MAVQFNDQVEVKKALDRPDLYFNTPQEVIFAKGISDPIKLEIVTRWETKLRNVADEDNVERGHHDLPRALKELEEAKEKLEERNTEKTDPLL